MRYVDLPYSAQPRPLPFYLAMEEYLAGRGADARNPLRSRLLWMWRVEPTVIFGRNQDAYAEVDMEYCRQNGIQFYRRKSGGGCVYADLGNIMISCIVPGSQSTLATVFESYTSAVAQTLANLGLNAHVSGRNDIEIDGLKVSGNAFFQTPLASIVHGTMLYEADMQHIARAITPSRAKLRSKGVSSVPAHITTISRHLDITITDFIDYMRRTLCHEPPLQLNSNDIAAIERIAEPYFADEWIYGPRRNRPAIERRAHIDGAGEFLIQLDIDPSGCISYINLGGDFFLLDDLDRKLLDRLKGIPHTRAAITEALAQVDTCAVISGLRKTDFINLVIP